MSKEDADVPCSTAAKVHSTTDASCGVSSRLGNITPTEACSALLMLKIVENNGAPLAMSFLRHRFRECPSGLIPYLRERFTSGTDPYPLVVVLNMDMQELLRCSVICRDILNEGWISTVRKWLFYPAFASLLLSRDSLIRVVCACVES